MEKWTIQHGIFPVESFIKTSLVISAPHFHLDTDLVLHNGIGTVPSWNIT